MDHHYAEMIGVLLLVAVGAAILLPRGVMRSGKDPEECKTQEQKLLNTVQFTQQNQRMLEDRITMLEDDKKLLEQQIHDQMEAKRQLEKELRRMKEDYSVLNESAAACKQINDDLNKAILSKDAHIARLNYRILQQEKVVTTLEGDLRQMTEEKSALAVEVQKHLKAIGQYEIERKDLQGSNWELREDVAILMRENGRLRCELLEKELRWRQAEEFLMEKGLRLEEAGKKITNMDDEKSEMNTRLWDLRGEYEAALHNLSVTRMRKERLEAINECLQEQLSILSEWREEVRAGLIQSDRDLM